jgi:hypothetical protein
MVGVSDRHAAAFDELVEWWQDLTRHAINSRAVLLPVPPRWGRTHLLNEFAAFVEDDEAISIVVRVAGGALPDGLGSQALELRNLFSEARVEHRIAELLGVDRLGGATQLGLGLAGLTPFLSPLATQVGLLLAGAAAGAAGKAWDDSVAGQEGMVARLARAVASASASVPVVVIIDDTDRLELDLAVVLVENLIERIDGQVLVVAAVSPSGDLMAALTGRAAYGLTEGRVRTVAADPNMGYQARIDLAAELCPTLPGAAIRRIGQRTRTFAEVFAVASAERLAELNAQGNDAAIVKMVNKVIDAQISWGPPSGLAVVLAWAGGIVHARQAERAAKILGEGRRSDDGDVRVFESLVRLADPASPRLTEQVDVLATSKRHRLAEIMLDAALEIGADPRAGLVDKVVAWQAAHRVRVDLQDHARLVGVQCQLVHGLEDLGDPAAASHVAETALHKYAASLPGRPRTPEHNDLAAAVLRLARTRQPGHDDPLVNATVAAVTAGGAAVGLEARVWAAVDLLAQPRQRERALDLAGQVTAELGRRNDLGAVGNRWRRLLAFHAGRAGYTAITQQLLTPMLDAADPEDGDAARAVLYAVSGPRADTRLQIIGLEAELQALPPNADSDRLRIHHALVADYGDLGDHRQALRHAEDELSLRRRSQGADHPGTLSTRGNIAYWTGWCGDVREALRLSEELLPDRERVLGPGHPDTLWTRRYIAYWTGEDGDVAEALRLAEDLLRDCKGILGLGHPDTLTARYEVAHWTGEYGNVREALRLFSELLPDCERVLSQDHFATIDTRGNIAGWTGWCGDAPEALRLFEELLPDRERILGPDHPDVLVTRSCIAYWTARCGDVEKALGLFQELPRDAERVLGPDHPDTLAIRDYVTGLSSQDVKRLYMFPSGPEWTGH